jgi:hypothetical protein
MTLIDSFGYLLVIMAILLAGYALRCVCRAQVTGRDPRPFAMPVFTMLAFAFLQWFLIHGRLFQRFESALAITWLIINFAMLCSIGWLLFHSTKRRGFK